MLHNWFNGPQSTAPPPEERESDTGMPFQRPTTYAVTRRFIKDRTARIGVMGLGRVGLPLAMRLSHAGFAVQGFDFDPARANQLHLRRSYLWRITHNEKSNTRDSGLRASCDLSQIAETDVIIICSPVISGETQEPGLQMIRETAFAVGSNLRAGQLIVVESPVDPRTAEEIVVPILESANGRQLKVSRNTGALDDVFVGISPKCAIDGDPSVNPNGKLVGGTDTLSMELAVELYSSIFTTVIPVPCPSRAEILKLLETSSWSHDACGALTSKLEKLAHGIGSDIPDSLTDRSALSQSYMQFPQSGVGDTNVPIDPFYLAWKASELGCSHQH